jgi:hypothetical protein
MAADRLVFKLRRDQSMDRDEREYGCWNNPDHFDEFAIDYPKDTPQCDGDVKVYLLGFDPTRYVLCAAHKAYLERPVPVSKTQ